MSAIQKTSDVDRTGRAAWFAQIARHGFGVGDSLTDRFRILTLEDVTGGPMVHDRAGVAIGIRIGLQEMCVAIMHRRPSGWFTVTETKVVTLGCVRQALLEAVGVYYHQIVAHSAIRRIDSKAA